MSIVRVNNLRIRDSPSINSAVLGNYNAGEIIKSGNQLINSEGRTWLRYTSSSGAARYVCAIDADGKVFIDLAPHLTGGNASSQGGATGFNNIPLQKNFPINGIKVSGCAFLSSCVKGGLTTQQQCIDCYHWASGCGKIRANDCWVIVGVDTLAKNISEKYGTTYHPDYTINKSNTPHYWVTQNGVEIFNSAGIGYH